VSPEPAPTNRLQPLLNELKRRKLFRAAAGYAVAGTVLVQAAAIVFNALELPNWLLRATLLAILGGFPVALIVGWLLDVRDRRRRGVIIVAAAGVLVAIGIGAFLLPRAGAVQLEKSIAVLPFQNLSDDRENEFFADGIQEDLLTTLAKIGDLKVISRTSVMPYRDRKESVREIGRTLGVDAILEGSVRRVGNRVRVNVQLIRAATDEQVWADAYERDLTDVFAIQSALAQEIASQLRARLSPNEKERVGTRPTGNSDAYLLYVQARAIATGSDTEERKNAIPLYEQAIRLDPTFALAHAQLSWLESWLYFSIEPVPERLQRAWAAAREAIRLQPDLPEARLALGFCYYYGERDYERALAEFEAARRGLPNDPAVFRAIGAIERRQGKWEQSTRSYEKAVSLNPNDAVLLRNLALNYQAVRDFPAAARTFDRAVRLMPDDFEMRSLRAWVDAYWKGDFRLFHQLFAEMPEQPGESPVATLARFNVYLSERNYEQALGVLTRSTAENLRGATTTPLPKSFLAAQVYRAMGDLENARTSYEQALPIAERALAESPNDPARHVLVGLIYAGLGRREEALSAGTRAVEMLPESRDAFGGPVFTISLARIYTLLGDHDQAITLLERSLATPNGVQQQELHFDRAWDPLRQHPRFQQLLSR
jgi:TolB-like protein/Flp pilus assembly protein TadD